jgi:hypothetical protein
VECLEPFEFNISSRFDCKCKILYSNKGIKLCVWIPLRWGVVNTTFCDKVCQWLATGRWFSPPIKLTATITEILLKVASNTITLTLTQLLNVHTTVCQKKRTVKVYLKLSSLSIYKNSFTLRLSALRNKIVSTNRF